MRRYSGGDTFELRAEEEEPQDCVGVPAVLTGRGQVADQVENKWRQLSPLAAAEVRARSCRGSDDKSVPK